MNRLLLLGVLAALVAVAQDAAPDAAKPDAAPAAAPAKPLIKAKDRDFPGLVDRDKPSILVIPLKGEIGKPMLFAMRRGFRMADRDPKLKAVIIDMDTPGGRVDYTREIIDLIRGCKVPVYVFVDRAALSAGSLVSLACDGIFMAPGAIIGCSTPIIVGPAGGVQNVNEDVNEKMKSAVRAMARALAQENGYDQDVAEAFVDRNKEVKIGAEVVSPKGELLTLTAEDAVRVIPPRKEPLLARAIVKDKQELAREIGLANAALLTASVAGGAQLARWIVAISPLLLVIGLIGVYIELKTPGFGVPGVVGILAFGLFFFGHYFAGLAGIFEAVLILVGIILLVLEIFVIPGFGWAGISGITCLLVGIVMAMIPHLPRVPALPGFETSLFEISLEAALLRLVLAFVLFGLVAWLLKRYLPKTRLYSRLVLQGSVSAAAGYVGSDVEGKRKLVGIEGEALTDLRPSGTALILGKRMDVVSTGEYVDKGDHVRIKRVNGPRVEVVRVEVADDEEPA